MDTFLLATEILLIVQQVKHRVSFYFLGWLGTSYPLFQVLLSSKHNEAVKRNRAQKEKMKTYGDAKQRAVTTELKPEDNVLFKHTGPTDKLTNHWGNDLVTVTKVSRPTKIVERKKDGKVFARNISIVKKYKHISDSDYHSHIDISGFAEMNQKHASR